MISRRIFITCAPLALGACATAPAAAPFADLEQRLAGGRLGVRAMQIGGPSFGWRADERFAMCSTFKAPLAAQLLRAVENGTVTLDDRVLFDADDLQGYAPLAKASLDKGALSLDAWLEGMVSLSDNTAANLMLEIVGGPAGFTAFLRSLGDVTTRLDRNEPMLNENLPGDPRDTTTPAAMAETLATILYTEKVLSPALRARLMRWMKESPTGRTRLRAGLPQEWIVGDKTGTSNNGAVNDIAFAEPPGAAPIVIAAYIDAGGVSVDAANEVHRAVGARVAALFGR